MTENVFQEQIRSLPEIANWPELYHLFDRLHEKPNPDWELPMTVCTSLGGDAMAVLPGAAALACMQLSIIFVDDILDNDPRGDHVTRGTGPTSNLALALQAAAFKLAATALVTDAQRTAVTTSLARMAVATAYGQHLDVQNLTGEENYWRVVQAKSTPFYGTCYELGAILAGADSQTTHRFYEFGTLTGEIIQLDDDLTDAFQKPANADWHEGRNNLLVLYARTADHPQRERFIQLLANIADAEALEEAQKILISSGAVSYCAYQLIQRQHTAYQLVEQMQLPHPLPLLQILDTFTDSLVAFLELSGVSIDRDLLLNRQT